MELSAKIGKHAASPKLSVSKPLRLDGQGWLKLLAITAQLGLLVLIIQKCVIEHGAFYEKLMPLVFGGFIIHALLPRPYRLTFFALLSLAGIFMVLGWADGAWLVGLGLALIGLCHLPIPFAGRTALLLIAGVTLTVMRALNVQVPWNKAVWPILGSMFMFRLIIYVHDLKHKKAPTSAAHALSYFFLLPNIAFPLFPAVDYGTFCRNYYNEDQFRIYQKGLRWMFWGIVHLLLYRYVNYYWVIGPEKVHDTATLVQYMIANLLLIIRVSGQFHLIVGILHLFGFNLPRIMDRFLLSEGFTDYWRRVNVYWKEFIQKIFYFPVYFRLRGMGNTARLVLATVVGFIVTWFFHSFQWFWIRGAFLLTGPDVLFWSGIGLLVLFNSLYEAKHGRKRTLAKGAATWRDLAGRTFRAAGVFIAMMILWSLWISSTLTEWLTLFSGAKINFLGVPATLVSITTVLGVAMWVNEKWSALTAEGREKELSFGRFALPSGAMILLLYFAVQPAIFSRFGPQASTLIADLQTNRLNERDEAIMERGYYEGLTDAGSFNSQLWELYSQVPDEWQPILQTAAVRMTGDFLQYELAPSVDMDFKDARLLTNRWGMRDDDYEKMPAANTFRMAMLGGSIEMGSGVLHEQTYEHLLERRLNAEHAGRGKYARYEILNFGVGGYNILQSMVTLENKVPAFAPNAVICMIHNGDDRRMLHDLIQMDPQTIPYDELKEILRRAGFTQKDERQNAIKFVEPHKHKIMAWAYNRMVAACRQRHILPIAISIPAEPGQNESKAAAPLLRLAEKAGFVVLNLMHVYDGAKGVNLRVAQWDKHPNPRGHQILADGIYQALRENHEKIPLGLAAVASDLK